MQMDIKPPQRKPIWLVSMPIIATLVLFLTVVVPWSIHLDLQDPLLRVLGPISAFIWVLVVGWASYHLTFQLASLFCLQWPCASLDLSGDVRFAVLYPTCDDFQKDACLSCVEQVYPERAFQLIICDDSKDEASQRIIDDFAAEYRVGVVRRHNKPEGYKAGNVNYAVDRAVDQPWFIIVDADQILPNTYLAAMAAVVREQPEEVAFVQGGHTADDLALIDSQDNRVESGRRPTPFQRAMGLEVQMFYDRDLTLRQTHGFLPCLGHGVAIRRSAWQAVCGIPHVVSEDFAFAMKLSQQGLYGVYADHVRSWESYPKDFGSFLIRLSKFSAGTAELLKLHLWGFLKSEVPWVAKLDFLMTVAWYCVMPLVVLNVYLSAYICHRLWTDSVGALHPLLPYLFVGMFLLTLVVLFSVAANPLRAVQYWFWATAVYCASMPITATCFFRGFFAAEFRRTPKGDGYVAPPLGLSIVMALVGMATIWLALRWRSPFSPVLVAHGCSYFAFVMPGLLDGRGIAWRLTRSLVLLPGSAFVVALVLMWHWGKL